MTGAGDSVPDREVILASPAGTPQDFGPLEPEITRALTHIQEDTMLLAQSLRFMAPAERRLAAGFYIATRHGLGEMDTAKALGMTWKALDNLRSRFEGATIHALASDGYSEREIASYMRIALAKVLGHTHEPTCHRGMSGEWEAGCQCKAIRARRGEHQADDGPEERAADGW